MKKFKHDDNIGITNWFQMITTSKAAILCLIYLSNLKASNSSLQYLKTYDNLGPQLVHVFSEFVINYAPAVPGNWPSPRDMMREGSSGD